MKKEIYHLRLLRFANHLKTLKQKKEPEIMTEFLECDWDKEIFRCDIEINMAYLRELSKVFPDDWIDIEFYSDMFGPFLKNGKKLGVTTGMNTFFGIKCLEIRHMFDVLGAQDIKKWGGVKLSEKSTGKNYAKNIFDYLDKQKRK